MILNFFDFLNITDATSPFLKVLLIINFVLSVIIPLIYLTQNLYLIMGLLFKNKTIKEAKTQHKFAYLICAHDEEKVVGQLIESIKQQDYHKELINTFVVCDNCTDNTKKIAEELGCIVLERNDTSKKGKCYALDFAIKEINANYGYLNTEAYIIMDADNLVTPNYTSKMNDCFDTGSDVATSYRNGKNLDKNWISACSSLIFLRECELIHKSRRRLNLGTYISGTGFYISDRLLKQLNGWPFTSLIEDIEFSIWCSNNNIKIDYQYDAVFYDEQPENIVDSNNQKLRWCKGSHQCFARHLKDFHKGIFKNKSFEAFEMLVHVNPFPAIMFLWTILYTILLGVNAIVCDLSFMDFVHSGISNMGGYFFGIYICGYLHALVAVIRGRKRIKCSGIKLFFYLLLFPIYTFIMVILSVKSLFVNVTWKKINHSSEVSITDIENKAS